MVGHVNGASVFATPVVSDGKTTNKNLSKMKKKKNAGPLAPSASPPAPGIGQSRGAPPSSARFARSLLPPRALEALINAHQSSLTSSAKRSIPPSIGTSADFTLSSSSAFLLPKKDRKMLYPICFARSIK